MIKKLAQVTMLSMLLFGGTAYAEMKIVVLDSVRAILESDEAKVLADAGIKLVGIDTPSMDHSTNKDLVGHQALYAGGVAILENIDLTGVPAGDYELIALPLRIVGCDSSPVRAILRELS